MSKEFIAEFLLSLTSPPESARATVGDFLEHAESRGPLWFWTAILRTASAQMLHEWIAAPLRLIAMAFVLWLQFIGASLVLVAGAILLWAFVYVADHHTGLELLTTLWDARVPLVPPLWIAYWMGVCVLPTLAAWFKGNEIAPKSQGQELALWTAIALVWTFMGITTKLPLSTLVAPPLALLAGMLRIRWNGLRPSLR